MLTLVCVAMGEVYDLACMEHREGMCRLEFRVCVVMGVGVGRINVAVECHTQYRHKPSGLYAELAHHNCPLLCVATMCSDEL